MIVINITGLVMSATKVPVNSCTRTSYLFLNSVGYTWKVVSNLFLYETKERSREDTICSQDQQ